MNEPTRATIALGFLVFLAACAGIDTEYPRRETMVYADTRDTYLGRELAAVVAEKPEGESGFLPLENGIDSLSARLLMAARAERSIDLQYYLIKTDITGHALLGALLDAADRGVRVRLLLDDVFTKGYDAGMAALDSHPNFDVRIFNPFSRGFGGWAWSGITDFGRINRRMHNKSFTVDNQITIIGGRNIADEYFGAREDAKFGDLDVVGIGPVVGDVSEMFDRYWNHETAVPVPAFAKMPDDLPAELERVRGDLAGAREKIRGSRYAAAVERTVLEYIEADTSVYEWAPYTLVYDSPDKGVAARADAAPSIRTPLRASLEAAQSEVVILSPYFVPRKTGIEALAELKRSGPEVTVITNALSANNHAAVHSGYAPSRKPLLESGVALYEVRPDADVPGSELFAASGAKATLHTKAFFVDRKEVFIGSFNFDPRSAFLNTESGVIIRSPVLAERFSSRVSSGLATQTFEVFLNDSGKLRWRGREDDREVIFEKEPQSTWRQRFVAGFMRLLPIKGQL